MWDLPACRVEGDRLYSRACDDLIGCATIVASLRTLSESAFAGCVAGVFTRAEEVGFIGAIQLAKSKLLPPDTTIVSLEASSEIPPAKMGEGPIIRVGDRSSIFDPPTTDFFVELVRTEKIRFHRCLMPVGTCEATARQL